MSERHVVYVVEDCKYLPGSDQEFQNIKFSTCTVLNTFPFNMEPNDGMVDYCTLFSVKNGSNYETYSEDKVMSAEFNIVDALDRKYGKNSHGESNWTIDDSCLDRFNVLCELGWSWPFEEK